MRCLATLYDILPSTNLGTFRESNLDITYISLTATDYLDIDVATGSARVFLYNVAY